MEDNITSFLNNIKEKDYVVFVFSYGVISGKVKNYKVGEDKIILYEAKILSDVMPHDVNTTITKLSDSIGWGTVSPKKE